MKAASVKFLEKCISMTLTRHQRRCLHQLRASTMFPSQGRVSAPLAAQDLPNEGRGCQSQRLMLQYGLIHGASAGTFHMSPMVTRAMEKLYKVIDREMQDIGGQKVAMPCLAPGQQWKESGRWDEMGSELLTLQDRHGSPVCLAPTHEEAVTSLVASESPVSYKRLPIMLYQIGRKFRDEMRPKNGLLRCREFEMKDLYTFDENEVKAQQTYRKVCQAYEKIFHRLGLQYVKVVADTGAMGGSLSHEYHLLASVGEDTLYVCSQCCQTVNKDLVHHTEIGHFHMKSCEQDKCGPMVQLHTSGVEIAHTFILGTKYSSIFNASFKDHAGKKSPLYMGCFGIGVTRLLAASIEVLSRADDIRWPRLLAPHQVCIIPQKEGFKSEICWDLAEDLCSKLTSVPSLKCEVVLDDRTKLSIGQRLNQAKAMGYPYVVALGKKALEETPLLELIEVYSGTSEWLTEEQIINKLNDVETIQLL